MLGWVMTVEGSLMKKKKVAFKIVVSCLMSALCVFKLHVGTCSAVKLLVFLRSYVRDDRMLLDGLLEAARDFIFGLLLFMTFAIQPTLTSPIQ